ncbi:MAG: hypothetical protein IT307_09700 [Chloroflexi bacterium]|nr:hypothetical protein [Chloroflexota bacterium]
MASLLLTIDVEPDLPKRRMATASSLSNIPALLTLQEQIPDVRLTCLVTYRVVSDPDALRVIERLQRDFDCEVGSHLHPEETPPFRAEPAREINLDQLPFELRAEKLRHLTAAISAHFPRPTSYRAGRWKLSPEDLGLLREQGYAADTTVTPFTSWEIEHGPNFAHHTHEPKPVQSPDFWEVPVTVVLNRGMQLTGNPVLHRYLRLFSHPLHGLPFPLNMIWDLVRPVRPVWFRPTYTEAEEMKELAVELVRRDPDCVLNMMFHSNELAVGGRPFIRTRADADLIIQRIVATSRFVTEQCGVGSTTLSEYVQRRSGGADRAAD